MSEISATEAALRFSDVLDSVEHAGESYTIIRHGKAVAHIEPISRGRGAEAKALLRRHQPDPEWPSHLRAAPTLSGVTARDHRDQE